MAMGMEAQSTTLVSPWTKWLPFRRQYFHMHFHEQKNVFLIKIALNFVPKGPIENKPALV